MNISKLQDFPIGIYQWRKQGKEIKRIHHLLDGE
jgi:hypothetical protein